MINKPRPLPPFAIASTLSRWGFDDVTAPPCGSSQTHLGTLMPPGGGHIIKAKRRMTLAAEPWQGQWGLFCRHGAKGARQGMVGGGQSGRFGANHTSATPCSTGKSMSRAIDSASGTRPVRASAPAA